MPTSNPDIQTRIAILRKEILSYQPGKVVPFGDERLVFPEKLVIGVIDINVYATYIVPLLRRAIHGRDGKLSKRKAYSEDQEEYLTKSISVIKKDYLEFVSHLAVFDKEAVKNLMPKVGCLVLSVSAFNAVNWIKWIKCITEITGRQPVCAVFGDRRSFEKARNELESNGITSIHELTLSVIGTEALSDDNRLQLLSLIHKCLMEGTSPSKETPQSGHMEEYHGTAKETDRLIPDDTPSETDCWSCCCPPFRRCRR